ncbi:MAG: acyltransferase [Lachnospiraceae bacterium]|nr:acyltransferase [Lachnospiraceae bacterium]
MTLKEAARGRNNNLDLIRFIAALLVILCHAYPISMGGDNTDILGRITHNQIHLGNLAVCVFFLYGGFLIAKSTERLQKAGPYFKARILRIFPCLIVVTFILTFLAGPCLTSLSVKDYFCQKDTYKYLLNSIMVLVHDLPGVFEGNIYGQTVNGPLWTLPIEFLCYILCFFVWKLGFFGEKRMKWTVPLFAAGYIGAKLLLGGNGLLLSALRPAGLFYAGILYYVYRDKIKLRWEIAVISLAGMILCTWLGILDETIFLFLPYLLLYIGYGTKYKFSNFAKHGEASYGIYLCGWPIQQIVCRQFGGSMNPILNFLLALPFAVLCGYLLNKLVEEPIGKRMKNERTKR